jgi:hypothetical protein
MSVLCLRAIAVTLTACWLAAGSLLVAFSSPALAVPAKPATDWAFYMLDGKSSVASALGCNQGKYDASHGDISSLVFLDFGGQDQGGALEIDNNQVSDDTIENMAANFAYNYYMCTGNDTKSVLDLAIGTNNSLSYVNSDGGSVWAGVVKATETSSKGKVAASQVVFMGGNDIENWNLDNPEGTKDWAQGFNSAGVGDYLDHGSADGCPADIHNNAQCSGTYTQYDYWYLSWGNPSALADPEIYVYPQQDEWTQISYYGAVSFGSRIGFSAELDEYDLDSSTYSPDQAWSEFWDALNQYSATADTPAYSTEVHDE